MLNNISEAQRFMLQAASAREDRLLQPPANTRGAVAKSIAAKLIGVGWVKEVKSANDALIWRRDAASGAAFGLKLTANGLKAVAVASAGAAGARESSLPTAAETAPPIAPVRQSTRTARAQAGKAAGKSHDVASTISRAPRAGSKLADVFARLSAENGATIGELMTATGRLEHTTRAALTGLRRRGYALSLARRERDGASVYRNAATDAEATR